jgi:hypothetical protein
MSVLNTQLSDLAANTQLDALAPLANSGYLRIYDGTQPATADTAITNQVLLAELRMNATAFDAAVAGVITARAITDDSSADHTGTATWFRLLKSDGTTKLWDGSAGTATANLILNSVAIQAGARVSVTSFTHTLPKQGA